jgi:adenylate cyclase
VTRRQRRRLVIASAIVLAVAGLLSVAFAVDSGYRQRQVADWLFLNKAATPEVSRFVVIVAIDDKTLLELRPYGRMLAWPRSIYADVVERLTEARARTIVFDILFDAPAIGDTDLERALRAASEQATAVVMPVAGDPLFRVETGRVGWLTFRERIEPLPQFRDLANGIGMADQLPDPDGTIRRMPLILDVGGQQTPALPLTAVAKFLRRPESWDGPVEAEAVPLAGRSIPIDRNGAMVINYAGGPYDSAPPAFPVVSLVDVLYGRVAPETFERKLVLIGATATALPDDYWTPTSLSGKMDGVEIQANAIDTILRGEFLHESPAWLTIALIFSFALLAGMTLVVLPPLVAAVISLLAFLGYVAATFAYFDQGGVILNLIFPPVSLYVTFAAIILYRAVFEQGQARAMRGLLGQYLSPAVVAEVARDPESLKLGGDEREMTVLFSDVRDFTTVSESLSPEQLVQLMTEYLTAMSDVIFRHEGTIDKYMGDAIMAFWGAPKRQEDHAARGVQAALGMLEEMDRLNQKWAAEGRPTLRMGIGLNTGVMKVGNMGSASRFDYTVMGDAVNLGARIESLNKEYGTSVIVGVGTLRLAGSGVRARFLDLVAVKGKTEPCPVYEVMTDEAATDEGRAATLRAYQDGIAAYQERDWLRAAARFQEALRLDPDDGPSRVYLDRCRRLIDEPPPADWDGVFVMTHK